jgi:hypothetical protein
MMGKTAFTPNPATLFLKPLWPNQNRLPDFGQPVNSGRLLPIGKTTGEIKIAAQARSR